ncbi:hypothetical protein [Flavobacterium sp.]|uniref:hypothetical protein n=1 Tax=Flavobacterium sp. TaxID=239 RepID=UPI004047A449
MKKLMFSAVALVAFSFAGMASNGEAKEIVKVEIKTEEVGYLPCNDLWHSQVSFYLDCGATLSNAMELADNGYEQCLINVYGSN